MGLSAAPPAAIDAALLPSGRGRMAWPATAAAWRAATRRYRGSATALLEALSAFYQVPAFRYLTGFLEPDAALVLGLDLGIRADLLGFRGAEAGEQIEGMLPCGEHFYASATGGPRPRATG